MTTTTILNYALLGIAEELAWLTPPWNSAEVRRQRRLTKLRAKIKRKLVKRQLKAQGKYRQTLPDALFFRCAVRRVWSAATARGHFTHSTPLPLP